MYILAERTTNGYVPKEIAQEYIDLCSMIEYGDAVEHEVEIWEYPSGTLYAVKSDRPVAEKDYYSLPSDQSWLPILEALGADVNKVEAAYQLLLKNEG